MKRCTCNTTVDRVKHHSSSINKQPRDMTVFQVAGNSQKKSNTFSDVLKVVAAASGALSGGDVDPVISL